MFQDPTDALILAMQACFHRWGDDPAYKNVAQKLREVERELDVMIASPGRRVAMRAAMPSASGQEPAGEYASD